MRPLSLLLTCFFFLGTTSLSRNGLSPELPRQGKDYALFFAVEDYEHTGKLTKPIDDVTAIAKELKTQYGFQTEVVANPTFAQIVVKIAEYQRKFSSGTFDQKGQLLVFFSGHGIQRGSNGYFLPKDGNPSILYEKVIEYDNWRYEIDQIDCQHILVTIDACYSLTFDPNWRNKTDRNFGRRGDADKDQVLLDHKAYRARHFFTSDGTNNQTPDRSTLARQFLTGLKSNKSTTGYITTSELYASYLLRAAPKPGGGDFGRDEVSSRFLFFRNPSEVPANTRADLAAWQKARSQKTCAGYRTYIAAFPNGDFASLARQEVAPCDEQDRMFLAWNRAKRTNTCEAYQAFIDGYPNSDYAPAATAKKQSLDCNSVAPPDNMIFISGGSFQMGDQFGDGGDDEKPVHAVTVSDFYLSRTELTFAEYDRFCEATGKGLVDDEGWGRSSRPIINVSWLDAVAYCNWWSQQSGLTPVYNINSAKVTPNWSANGYRLPTEAEWEYAARSGGKRQRFGNGQDIIRPTVANFDASADYKKSYSEVGTYRKQTLPVDSFSPNESGLVDMSGNVWEWCWDRYDSDYYGKSPGSNPKGPDTGSSRVIRGGSWFSYPVNCRTAYRHFNDPTYRNNSVGFRLARSSR